MSIARALQGASSKPAGKRPYFLEPETERVFAVALALAQELAVARQRQDTVERLLERRGVMLRSEIDDFAPTEGEAKERALWTQEYLSRVLRIIQQESEAGSPGDVASEDVAVELNAALTDILSPP